MILIDAPGSPRSIIGPIPLLLLPHVFVRSPLRRQSGTKSETSAIRELDAIVVAGQILENRIDIGLVDFLLFETAILSRTMCERVSLGVR